MSEEQAMWAIQNLYENPRTRDELSDSDAQVLLQWAEEQIERLASLDMDDASFDAAYDALIDLIRRMNRLAGRLHMLPPEDVEIALNRIAENAAQVGLPIPADNLSLYVRRSAAPDNHDNVRLLITLVMSGQQPSA